MRPTWVLSSFQSEESRLCNDAVALNGLKYFPCGLVRVSTLDLGTIGRVGERAGRGGPGAREDGVCCVICIRGSQPWQHLGVNWRHCGPVPELEPSDGLLP